MGPGVNHSESTKLPDGGALLSAQEVEEVHQELGMLVVGLHHTARRLHQLYQDSNELVTQLYKLRFFFFFVIINSNGLSQSSLFQSATIEGNF
jgi:hypothetical protein